MTDHPNLKPEDRALIEEAEIDALLKDASLYHIMRQVALANGFESISEAIAKAVKGRDEAALPEAVPPPPVTEVAGDVVRLVKAVRRIVRWHGEFPDTGRTWDDGSPMSYAACWGSNGERDYMREVARSALAPFADRVPSEAEDGR